jgi:hypothetical protein
MRSSAEAHARHQGWSDHELADLRRAAKILWQFGLSLDTDCGITDEGEPWYVFFDASSGEIVVHFARVDGQYIACAPFRDGGLEGHVFHDLVDRFLHDQISPRLNAGVDSTPAA